MDALEKHGVALGLDLVLVLVLGLGGLLLFDVTNEEPLTWVETKLAPDFCANDVSTHGRLSGIKLSGLPTEQLVSNASISFLEPPKMAKSERIVDVVH